MSTAGPDPSRDTSLSAGPGVPGDAEGPVDDGATEAPDAPERADVADVAEDSAADADPRADRIAAAVSAWTRHLVDLGGRNTLLWYRDLPTGTLDLTTAHPAGLARFMAGRETTLSTLVREPGAHDEALRRARAIAAKSRELKEERGIATGFLALGMATWSLGPTVSREPAAPILLRPITLRPTGAAEHDYVLDLGDEVELNPVLVHYLSTEQGIDLDADALEELAMAADAFDPFPVYDAVSTACADVPDFSIAPRIVIGTFSYAKLPMVADLTTQGVDLADHDVVAALAGDPTAMRSVRSELPDTGAPLDRDPERDRTVLDADSSQQEAIDVVREGSHLVIHGPPGTGKSQTIANLVAGLAADGKRVLFVAEKRAAIDAVVGRLERVGLGGLVLDLHDGARSRRRIAEQLVAGLDAAAVPAAPAPDRPPPGETVAAVRTTRAALVDHVEAMHEIRMPWGVSAYQAQEAISALAARPHPPRCRVRLRGDALSRLSRGEVAELGSRLAAAASLGAWAGDDIADPSGAVPGTAADPWFGARIRSPEEAMAAREVTARLAGGGMDALARTVDDVFTGVDLPRGTALRDWARTLSTVAKVRDTLEVFRPEVFDVPLDDLVAATGDRAYRKANGIEFGWFERRGLVRQARRLLRPGPPPEDLHAALIEASAQRSTWREMAGAGGRPELPVDLDLAQAAYDDVITDLRWLDERLAARPDRERLLDVDLDTLRTRLAELDARPDRLAVVPTVIGTLDDLEAAGFGAVVADLAGRGVDADDVAGELDFVWWTSISEDLMIRDPRIAGHHGDRLRRIAADFAVADANLVRDNAARVREAAADHVRRVIEDDPAQESLIRTEAAKSRRHKSLRDLLPAAGRLATTARPCWVMSPLVVASVLPPGVWFDVVVFDEASQIPPAEAVSAISRAHQVVVAGDAHQLPPTTFFTTVTDGGEETDDLPTEGVESVLDVLAALLPSRRLSWHYRSLDERLIGFANTHIYDGSLVTFPGIDAGPVLAHELVEGTGVLHDGTGAVESTGAEVERVVHLVLDHARSRPEESLGVIALGIQHASRVEDALRDALSDEPDEVQAFFTDRGEEPFFVKNLERVQGDERDAVILTIGYGKTPHGRVLHRFGPLNVEGGERRLNVAVTRARRRMTVVSSLVADDLDPAKLKARGARLLREFLRYAAEGGAVRAPSPEGDGPVPGHHSIVMAELARGLRSHGLVVHEDHGSSADPIDLAVEHRYEPGRLLLAVESDGPGYAAQRSARDRDRLRVEQLTRLGWRHLRVWSSDVFRDPAPDIARIVAASEGRDLDDEEARVPEQDETAQDGSDVERSEGPPRSDGAGATEGDGSTPGGADAAADAPAPDAPTPPAPSETPAARPGKGRRLLRRRSSGPEQTRDDTDAGWGEREDQDAHDRWLQEQRPPHWE